jgi:cell division protein FtsB
MARTGRVHGLWSVAVWLLAVGLLLGTTPSTARHLAQWRTLRAENTQLEQRLVRLHAEERALEAELKRVQTDLGREALARQRGWLRKGEEPLRINRP